MKKDFETMFVWRVWYFDNNTPHKCFFTHIEDARDFCKLHDGAILNKWKWEMNIEE